MFNSVVGRFALSYSVVCASVVIIVYVSFLDFCLVYLIWLRVMDWFFRV